MIIIHEVTTHVKRREGSHGRYQTFLFRRRWRVVALFGIVPLFAWMAHEERLCEV